MGSSGLVAACYMFMRIRLPSTSFSHMDKEMHSLLFSCCCIPEHYFKPKETFVILCGHIRGALCFGVAIEYCNSIQILYCTKIHGNADPEDIPGQPQGLVIFLYCGSLM